MSEFQQLTVTALLNVTVGCLFRLAVECVTTRLSMRIGLISWIKPGTNPAWGAKIRSGTYAIRLISFIEGLTVSSLICDRWLTRKLVTFTGSTNSLEC